MSSRQNVLYLCPNGFLGGAENFVVTISRLHGNQGKFKPIILFFNDGHAHELASEYQIESYVLKTKFRLLNPFKLFLASYEIYRLHRKLKVDVVHFTMPYSLLAGFLLFFLTSSKKVWYQHGPVGGRLDRLASLFPVDALLFNSSYTLSKHEDSTPKLHRPLKLIIPPPIKIVRDSKDISTHLNIATIGRICIGKDQLSFLKAIKSLKRRPYFHLCHFSIIGSPMNEKDQIYEQELINYIRENKLSECVKLIKHQKNLDDLYRELDILVHNPQFPEALGLVIAEAMANGVSVLASPRGGSNDLLQDGRHGFIIPEEAPLSINMDKVISVHLNEEDHVMIQTKRRQAYIHIENNYSESIVVQKIEALYQDLLLPSNFSIEQNRS